MSSGRINRIWDRCGTDNHFYPSTVSLAEMPGLSASCMVNSPLGGGWDAFSPYQLLHARARAHGASSKQTVSSVPSVCGTISEAGGKADDLLESTASLRKALTLSTTGTDGLADDLAAIADAYAERLAMVLEGGDIPETEALLTAEAEVGREFVRRFGLAGPPAGVSRPAPQTSP